MKNRIILFVGYCICILISSCNNKMGEVSSEGSGVEVGQTDIKLIIHLQGINECNASLLPLTGTRTMNPIIVLEGLQQGQADTLFISRYSLPGEFILSFDYRENDGNISKRSEKHLVASDRDLELWIHPGYCNNEDSTWFQNDEKENKIYDRFFSENRKQKEPLISFQNFLLNYDDTVSGFYRKSVREYEKRRLKYNRWVEKQIQSCQPLFVSNLFEFQKIPEVEWEGSNTGRKQSLKNNYFNEIDLGNPSLVRAADMKEWMDKYVNLFDEFAGNNALHDSMLMLAGTTALEKARLGHPLVYGWTAEYFFKKYESLNLDEGIQMSQTHLEEPDCLTLYKQVIQKRIIEKEKIIPGEKAPNFYFINNKGDYTMFHNYNTSSRFKLILFWTTDCWKCIAMSKTIYTWHQQLTDKNLLTVFAINLDPEYQKAKWEGLITKMPEWEHMIDGGGFDSEVANAYCIIMPPTMVLIDSNTNKIIDLPETIDELETKLKKNE